jgi:hypothetical protein
MPKLLFQKFSAKRSLTREEWEAKICSAASLCACGMGTRDIWSKVPCVLYYYLVVEYSFSCFNHQDGTPSSNLCSVVQYISTQEPPKLRVELLIAASRAYVIICRGPCPLAGRLTGVCDTQTNARTFRGTAWLGIAPVMVQWPLWTVDTNAAACSVNILSTASALLMYHSSFRIFLLARTGGTFVCCSLFSIWCTETSLTLYWAGLGSVRSLHMERKLGVVVVADEDYSYRSKERLRSWQQCTLKYKDRRPRQHAKEWYNRNRQSS